MPQQGNRKNKSDELLYIPKNWKFSCVLYAHSQFLCSLARFDPTNWGVRQPVQPHTFHARMRQDISAASFCRCKLPWWYPVLTRSLIFLQLWTAAP